MRGLPLFAVFSVTYGGLISLTAIVVPRAQSAYRPDPPKETGPAIYRSGGLVGDRLPDALAKYKATKFVIHEDCLECSLIDRGPIRMAFSDPEILNVVIARDRSDYARIAKETPHARIVYLEPESIRPLRAMNGPELYRIDGQMRIIGMEKLTSGPRGGR